MIVICLIIIVVCIVMACYGAYLNKKHPEIREKLDEQKKNQMTYAQWKSEVEKTIAEGYAGLGPQAAKEYVDKVDNELAASKAKAEKSANVIKGAVVGGIIGGETGAVIGAIHAADKNSREKE